METATVVVLLIIALFCIAFPATYTILRLADKIGPKDGGLAAFIGFFLWYVGAAGCIGSIGAVLKIIEKYNP